MENMFREFLAFHGSEFLEDFDARRDVQVSFREGVVLENVRLRTDDINASLEMEGIPMRVADATIGRFTFTPSWSGAIGVRAENVQATLNPFGGFADAAQQYLDHPSISWLTPRPQHPLSPPTTSRSLGKQSGTHLRAGQTVSSMSQVKRHRRVRAAVYEPGYGPKKKTGPATPSYPSPHSRMGSLHSPYHYTPLSAAPSVAPSIASRGGSPAAGLLHPPGTSPMAPANYSTTYPSPVPAASYPHPFAPRTHPSPVVPSLGGGTSPDPSGLMTAHGPPHVMPTTAAHVRAAEAAHHVVRRDVVGAGGGSPGMMRPRTTDTTAVSEGEGMGMGMGMATGRGVGVAANNANVMMASKTTAHNVGLIHQHHYNYNIFVPPGSHPPNLSALPAPPQPPMAPPYSHTVYQPCYAYTSAAHTQAVGMGRGMPVLSHRGDALPPVPEGSSSSSFGDDLPNMPSP
ncbi:unnamed protein product [Vitrella brassicaformis CCMP3155]|uniref:Uncharacterized protein n=2 Tax=Vitrella brassicaformis TaxID=1169539 RepID=A0A0G4EC13_VITBC|nr:unnamed protein product [Vitrella brassicaformis CCMP3155]|eukprot:CEL92864.1 unnamed protein product [Vitrella brassicaformis CCMP3155]